MSGKIKYIKVARRDGNGVDITETLESLSTIVIPLDGGNVEYIIGNRTRELTYYLFFVTHQGSSDIPSANKSNLNFDFSASMDVEEYSARSPTILPFNSILYDSQSYATTATNIDTGTGYGNGDVYEFQTTYPSIGCTVIVTGSIEATNNLGNTWNVALMRNAETIDNINWVPNTDGATQPYHFELSSSVDILLQDKIYVKVNIDASLTMIEYTATLARMEITNARNDDELECAVEPFLTSPFYGGDCDVLYGNASQGIPNQFLQDVDYSTDATRPVNYLLIQNNTAQKATVPESHYTQLSSANIRYNGSKIQSETINTFTTTHFEISQSHYLTGSFQNNTVKQITETDFNKPFNIGNFGSTPSTDVIPVYAIYFEDAFTQHSTGNSSNGAYVTFVTPKYLITPELELLELDNNPINQGLVDSNFTPGTPIKSVPNTNGLNWFWPPEINSANNQQYQMTMFNTESFNHRYNGIALNLQKYFLVIPNTNLYLPHHQVFNQTNLVQIQITQGLFIALI